MAIQLVPYTEKGSVLGLILCYCHLKILSNFIFVLGFCKRESMGPWGMCEQRRQPRYTHWLLFLGALFAYNVIIPNEHRILVEPQCTLLHCLVTMKHICMYKLQNMDCVILVIPHRSEMLLYLPLEGSLHNIKMNGKICANNL